MNKQGAICQVLECSSPVRGLGYCNAHYQRFRKYGTTHRPTTEERFWSKVDKSGDCWIWTGARNRDGYGLFKANLGNAEEKKRRAHQFVYESTVGPFPDGFILDHRCRNKACVNPDHLRPVTHKQNAENLGDERTNNTSGARGVYWVQSRQKWRATVQLRISVGEFNTLEEARAAVKAKRNEVFTHNDADRDEAS